MLEARINTYVTAETTWARCMWENTTGLHEEQICHSFQRDVLFYIQIILVFLPNEYYLLEQKIIFKVRKTETRGFHSHLYRNFDFVRQENSRSRYTAVIYLNTRKDWRWKKIGLSWEFMFVGFILSFKKVLPPGYPSQLENTLRHMQPL